MKARIADTWQCTWADIKFYLRASRRTRERQQKPAQHEAATSTLSIRSITKLGLAGFAFHASLAVHLSCQRCSYRGSQRRGWKETGERAVQALALNDCAREVLRCGSLRQLHSSIGASQVVALAALWACCQICQPVVVVICWSQVETVSLAGEDGSVRAQARHGSPCCNTHTEHARSRFKDKGRILAGAQEALSCKEYTWRKLLQGSCPCSVKRVVELRCTRSRGLQLGDECESSVPRVKSR